MKPLGPLVVADESHASEERWVIRWDGGDTDHMNEDQADYFARLHAERDMFAKRVATLEGDLVPELCSKVDKLRAALHEAVDFYNTVGSPHTDHLRLRARAALGGDK